MIPGKVVPADRIPCCMAGCRRTAPRSRYPDSDSIICGRCFRFAPAYMRRRLRRLERLVERIGDPSFADTKPGSYARRALVLHHAAWDQLLRRVVEAKAGIS